MILGLEADTHFRGKDLDAQLRGYRAIREDMQACGVEWALHAGDLVDRPAVGDRYASAGRIADGVKGVIHEAGIPTLVARGNHDGDDGLQVFGRDRLIVPVYRPRVVRIGAGVLVGVIPWMFPREGDLAALKAQVLESFRDTWTGKAEFKVLLGHVEMSGVLNGFGVEIPAETWAFTEEELLSTGADLLALGHVHRRQKGYLGAAWQLNHGEAGNPAGWCLVSTEDRAAVFRETPGPRYLTIPGADLRGREFPPDTQIRVLLTDPGERETLPDHLPGNVLVEDRTSRSMIPDRDIPIDPDADPVMLLSQWLDALEAPHVALSKRGSRERLLVLAQEVAQETGEGGRQVMGSITGLHRVRVRGFGPHEDTVVEFPEGWSALTGPTGAGKTFVLEALFAALDGAWVHPKRSSFLSTITAPDGLGILEAEFSGAGHRWRIIRRVQLQGKGSDHQIELLQVLPDGSEQTSAKGTPRSGIQGTIEQLVGSRRIRLGSILLSQKATGDLVSADESDRMVYLNEFMRLERFGLLVEAAKVKAKTTREKIAPLAAQVGDLQGLRDSLSGLRATVAGKGFTVSMVRAEVQAQEGIITAQDTRARDLRAQKDERDRLLGDRARRVGTLRGLEQALQGAETRVQESTETLKVPREDEEILAIEARVRTRKEQLAALDLKAEALAKARSDANLLELRLARDVQTLEGDLQQARDQERFLDGVGCRSQGFLPCPLIDHARCLVEGRPKVEQDLEVARKRRDVDLPPLLGEIKALELDLQPRDTLRAENEADEARLRVLNTQKVWRAKTETDLRRDQGEQERIQGEIAKARQDLQETESLLAQTQPDVVDRAQEAERTLAQAQEALRKMKVRLDQALRDEGAATQELQGVEKRTREAEAVESQLRTLERDLDLLGVLVQGWGRTGVPQLLIASDLPTIQRIIDEVCEIDYQGRYGLTLSTQRAKRDGDLKESFAILFRSPKGHVFDAGGSSGGEEGALRAILRAAQIAYLSEKAAASYSLCLMDEPTANQDREIAEATLGMINRLRDRFSQAVIVSHDDLLLAQIPNQIRPFWA